MPKDTPGVVAANAINSANDNLARAIDKMPSKLSFEQLLEVVRVQAEIGKASALLEAAVQLQALSAIARPGSSIRYGMADVADAIKTLKEGAT